MSKELAISFALAAGAINTVGLVPYIRDIFRRKTKPERAMWWIYAVLFAVLFAAQMNAGAGWLLIVTASYILAAVFIAVLSIPYGYGSFHKRDLVSFIIAALGLVLWALTNNPLLAILMVIIVDIAGFWLTLAKTWHAPYSETLISWQLAFLAATLSIFAVSSWNFTIIIYPLYSIIGTALLVALIMYRRTKVKTDSEDF